MALAMEGLKVLDFSMGIAGPKAGMLCAAHGAEVVKIEGLEGDWSRSLGESFGGQTAYSFLYNRGKQSLSVNLKDAAAQEMIRELAVQADVIIEAFRPGVMQRFGLDYPSLSKMNPNLVYASVNGFGSTGPMVAAPATDIVMQAFSGFMACNKDDSGHPRRLDLFIVDLVTGLYAFQGILTALMERDRSEGGGGRHVECTLLHAALALQSPKLLEAALGDAEPIYYVPLGVYETADGHVSVVIRNDPQFVRLCHALTRGDLLETGLYSTNQDRVVNKATLEKILGDEFRQRDTDVLCELLTRSDILHSKVNRHRDILAHPQVQETGIVDWVSLSPALPDVPVVAVAGPGSANDTSSAPALGADSVTVLRGWGVDGARIGALLDKGVIRSHGDDTR